MLSLSCKNYQGPKSNVSETMHISKLLQEILTQSSKQNGRVLQPIRKDLAIGDDMGTRKLLFSDLLIFFLSQTLLLYILSVHTCFSNHNTID